MSEISVTVHGDYILTTDVPLPLEQIRESCIEMRKVIDANFVSGDKPFVNPEIPRTTPVFARYNLLLYPFPGFYETYFWIRDFFRFAANDPSPYYIQCWLNVFEYGEFINWHGHSVPEVGGWHGFLCVDSEPSKTSYRLPNGSEIDIPSKNGQIVLSRSAGDQHRTWPWEDREKPRITIAFDIYPRGRFPSTEWLNHWMPI